MKGIERITVTESVALITLHKSPADIHFISSVFGLISEAGINVDMISQTAPLGGEISISFTINDYDLTKVLSLSAKIRLGNPNVKLVVSDGNAKISLYGEEMRDNPGIASQAFKLIATVNADVRLITTSEVDISILVARSDLETVLDMIQG
jgi:aspartokinase